MVNRTALTLKVLVNRFHKADEAAFLKPLSAEEKASLEKVLTSKGDLEGLKAPLEHAMEAVHYSWMAEVVKKLPIDDQALAASTLSEQNQDGVLTVLSEEKLKITSLKGPARKFLQRNFFKDLQPSDVLPLSFLEPSELLPLLQLEKNKLLELIDFLGIYDLAEKIRSVVDKKKLSSIYRALSTQEQKFLSYTLRSGEKTLISDLDLAKWDGNQAKLKALLHKKGLIRLAKAISDESTDFHWHLFHRLDTGRAAYLEKNMFPKPADLTKQKLKDQVLHIVNIVNVPGEAS